MLILTCACWHPAGHYDCRLCHCVRLWGGCYCQRVVSQANLIPSDIEIRLVFGSTAAHWCELVTAAVAHDAGRSGNCALAWRCRLLTGGCCRNTLLQSLVLLHQPPVYAQISVAPCCSAASLQIRRRAMAKAHLFNMASCAQAKFMVGFSAEADKLFADANQTASEAFSSIRTVSNIYCFRHLPG